MGPLGLSLLLLVASPLVGGYRKAACGTCSCEGTTAACDFRGLPVVPLDIDPKINLTTLNLTGNFIVRLNSGDFQGFPALRWLSVAHNAITKISQGAFDNLTSLLSLDISYNQLAMVPAMSLPALSSLDLSHNILTALGTSFTGTPALASLVLDKNLYLAYDHGLDPRTFRPLSSLHSVSLQHVSLMSFPEALFNTSIVDLQLSHNVISEVPEGLHSMRYLRSINISYCGLTSVHPKAIQGLNLSRVDLSHNQLTQLDVDWGNNMISLVDLTHNSLQTLPSNIPAGQLVVKSNGLATATHLHPVVRGLDLLDNALEALGPAIVQQTTSLRISNNPIEVLPAVPLPAGSLFLDMEETNIASWPNELFSKCRGTLISIHSATVGMTSFPGALAGGTFAALTYLDLSDNAISTLPDNVFTNFPMLEVLELGNNPLRQLAAGLFARLTKLRSLMLDESQLTIFPSSALPITANSSLAFLDLSLNFISHLPAPTEQRLPVGVYLNLANNPINVSTLEIPTVAHLDARSTVGFSGTWDLKALAPRLEILSFSSVGVVQSLPDNVLWPENMTSVTVPRLSRFPSKAVNIQTDMLDIALRLDSAPSSLRTLTVSGSHAVNFQSVPPLITSLSLSEISRVRNCSIKDLRRLETLSLSAQIANKNVNDLACGLFRLQNIALDGVSITNPSVFTGLERLSLGANYPETPPNVTFPSKLRSISVARTEVQILDQALQSIEQLSFSSSFMESDALSLCLSASRNVTKRFCASLSSLSVQGGTYLLSYDITLVRVPALRQLALIDSLLLSVTRSMFSASAQLTHLDLSNNQIVHCDKDWAFDLRQLAYLDMSFNPTLELPAGSLQHCPLHILRLSSCGLNSFAIPLPLLRNLDLSMNNLTVFPNITSKRSIDIILSRNIIERIPDLSGLQVRNLDLSNNLFQAVSDPLALGRLPLLKTLNLASNHYIGGVTGGPLPQLRSLFLFGTRSESLGDSVLDVAVLNQSCMLRSLLMFDQRDLYHLPDFSKVSLPNLKQMLFFQASFQYGIELHRLAGLPSTSELMISCGDLDEIPPPIEAEVPQIKCLNPTNLKSPGSGWDAVIELQSPGICSAFSRMGLQCTCTGQLTCTLCPPGTFGNLLQPGCKKCTRGQYYNAIPGSQGENTVLACQSCPTGTYCRSSGCQTILDCVVCPAGTNTQENSVYRACTCLEEYYRLDAFGECFPCDKPGMNCSNEYLRPSPGFWWPISTAVGTDYNIWIENLLAITETAADTSQRFPDILPTIFECLEKEACLGGVEARCDSKYTGPLCAQCQDGHWLWGHRCLECPSLSALIGGMVAVSLLLSCGIGYLIRSGVRAALSYDRDIIGRTPIQKRYDKLVMLVKSSVGFYQILGEVREQLGSKLWPSAWNKISLYLQIVALKFSIFDCLGSGIHLDSVSSIKILLIAQLWLCFLIALTFGVLSCVRPSKRSQFTTAAVSSLSLMVFLLFPSTCTAIFSLLRPCQQLGNSSYLPPEYMMDCSSERFHKWKRIAWGLAFGYGVGLPLLLGIAIWRLDPANSAIGRGLQFFYREYRQNRWWWAIADLYRKLFFTAVLKALPFEEESSGFVAVGFVVSFSFSVFFDLLQPIRDLKVTNQFKAEAVRRKLRLAAGSCLSWIPNMFRLLTHTWSSPKDLEHLSLNCIWLNFVVLALLLSSENVESEDEQVTVTVVLFLLNGVVLSGFLWHMGLEVFHLLAATCCGHRSGGRDLNSSQPLINAYDDDDEEMHDVVRGDLEQGEGDDSVDFVGIDSELLTPAQQLRALRRRLQHKDEQMRVALLEEASKSQSEQAALTQQIDALAAQLAKYEKND